MENGRVGSIVKLSGNWDEVHIALVKTLRRMSQNMETSLKSHGVKLGHDRFVMSSVSKFSDLRFWLTMVIYELNQSNPRSPYAKHFRSLGFGNLLDAYAKDILEEKDGL